MGTVSDSTSQAPLAVVLVEVNLSSGEVVRSAVTGPGGTFRIDGLAPGEYDIRASLPGWEALPSPAARVAGGSVTRFGITMVERPYRLNPLTVLKGYQELVDDWGDQIESLPRFRDTPERLAALQP